MSLNALKQAAQTKLPQLLNVLAQYKNARPDDIKNAAAVAIRSIHQDTRNATPGYQFNTPYVSDAFAKELNKAITASPNVAPNIKNLILQTHREVVASSLRDERVANAATNRNTQQATQREQNQQNRQKRQAEFDAEFETKYGAVKSKSKEQLADELGEQILAANANEDTRRRERVLEQHDRAIAINTQREHNAKQRQTNRTEAYKSQREQDLELQRQMRKELDAANADARALSDAEDAVRFARKGKESSRQLADESRQRRAASYKNFKQGVLNVTDDMIEEPHSVKLLTYDPTVKNAKSSINPRDLTQRDNEAEYLYGKGGVRDKAREAEKARKLKNLRAPAEVPFGTRGLLLEDQRQTGPLARKNQNSKMGRVKEPVEDIIDAEFIPYSKPITNPARLLEDKRENKQKDYPLVRIVNSNQLPTRNSVRVVDAEFIPDEKLNDARSKLLHVFAARTKQLAPVVQEPTSEEETNHKPNYADFFKGNQTVKWKRVEGLDKSGSNLKALLRNSIMTHLDDNFADQFNSLGIKEKNDALDKMVEKIYRATQTLAQRAKPGYSRDWHQQLYSAALVSDNFEQFLRNAQDVIAVNPRNAEDTNALRDLHTATELLSRSHHMSRERHQRHVQDVSTSLTRFMGVTNQLMRQEARESGSRERISERQERRKAA